MKLAKLPQFLRANFLLRFRILGAPKHILELFQRLHFPFYDVKDEHYFLRNNKLVKILDYWKKIENILEDLQADRKTDRSLEDFIRKQKTISPEMKKNFITYVEGFHAGGPKALQMSTWNDEEKLHTSIKTLSFITGKSFNYLNAQIESFTALLNPDGISNFN